MAVHDQTWQQELRALLREVADEDIRRLLDAIYAGQLNGTVFIATDEMGRMSGCVYGLLSRLTKRTLLPMKYTHIGQLSPLEQFIYAVRNETPVTNSIARELADEVAAILAER